MELRNEYEFMLHLTNRANYGDLSIYLDCGISDGLNLRIEFINNNELISENVRLRVSELIHSRILNIIEEHEINIQNLNQLHFKIINNDNKLYLGSGSFISYHDCEEEEIRESIKDLLDKLLYENYVVNIEFSGIYTNKLPKVSAENIYLGIIKDDDEEIEYNDEDGYYRQALIKHLLDWVLNFSEQSSNGAYNFDSFNICISDCWDESDNYYSFVEESKYPIDNLYFLGENGEKIEVEPETF